MNRFNKVIFVCMGNTCRSPMAATIMSNLMPDMRCESRGVVVLFPEPYNPKAVAVASRHGMIMPSNVSVQIANEDFSIVEAGLLPYRLKTGKWINTTLL